jgi:hypothetical protein
MATAYIHKDGLWQKAENLAIHKDGIWQNANKVYVHKDGSWQLGFDGLVPPVILSDVEINVVGEMGTFEWRFSVNLNDYIDAFDAPVIEWLYETPVLTSVNSTDDGYRDLVATQDGQYAVTLDNVTANEIGYTLFTTNYTVVTQGGEAQGSIEFRFRGEWSTE